jgi:signal peptidase II
MKRNKTAALLCAVFLVILFLDAGTKWMTQYWIPPMGRDAFWYPYGGIGVFQDFLGIQFSIVHVTNKGAAWSAFSNYQSYLVGLRIALIAAMVVFVVFFNKNKSILLPLTLILAGAVGNIIDYFVYGHVVDMIYFNFWGYSYPVFNIADSAVTVGVVWILLQSWWKK